MSKKIEFLQISPVAGDEKGKGELFSFRSFECPDCNGQGYFYHGGWAQKFKKHLDDPDYVECEKCKGTGMLQAKVVVGWMPEDLPSNCPKDVFDL